MRTRRVRHRAALAQQDSGKRTLVRDDKIKRLDRLSSAKTNSQAIAFQTFEDVANILSLNPTKVCSSPAVVDAKSADTIEVNSGLSIGATASAGNSS